MEAALARLFPVRVETRGARGRGLFAARALPAGAIVLAAAPAALVPTQPELRCAWCLAGASAGARLQRCARCRRANYCGRDCQAADWPDHARECRHLASAAAPAAAAAATAASGPAAATAAASSGAQALPLLASLPQADAATLMLLGRLEAGRALSDGATASAASAASASASAASAASASSAAPSLAHAHVYTHCAADVAAMVRDSSGRLDAHFSSLVRRGRAAGFLPAAGGAVSSAAAALAAAAAGGVLGSAAFVGGQLATVAASSSAQSSSPSSSPAPSPASAAACERAQVAALLSFDVNNLGVLDELMGLRGSAVCPAAALLNHSCCPNACLGFACAEEVALELAAAAAGADAAAAPQAEVDGRLPRSPARRARRVLVFRTTREVAEGEELTHTYVDQVGS